LAGEYDPIVGTIRFERGVLGIDWNQIKISTYYAIK
jgi:hypothetical protein